MAQDKQASSGSNAKVPTKAPAGFSGSEPKTKPISQAEFSKNKKP